MDTNWIISQIIGILTSATVIVIMQMKNIKTILLLGVVCNTLGGLSLLFAGGISGGAVYAAAIIQSAVYFVFRTKGKEPPKWLAVFFVLLFVGCSASTYSRPEDIIACVAALTCALSLVQERPFIFRSLMFVNGILWCFYDVSVAAYTMIISHLITSASAMIGMIRLDFKKKSANDK